MILFTQTSEEMVVTIKKENDRICDVFSYMGIMSTQLKSMLENMLNIDEHDRNTDLFYDLLSVANDMAWQMREYANACEKACDVRKTIC